MVYCVPRAYRLTVKPDVRSLALMVEFMYITVTLNVVVFEFVDCDTVAFPTLVL